MRTLKAKRVYIPPTLEQIKLDNEISLILESNPPVGPYESLNKVPDCFQSDPFKINIG